MRFERSLGFGIIWWAKNFNAQNEYFKYVQNSRRSVKARGGNRQPDESEWDFTQYIRHIRKNYLSYTRVNYYKLEA